MAASQDELPRMSDLSGSTARYNNWVNNFGAAIAAVNASIGIPVWNALGGSVGAASIKASVASVVSNWAAAYASITQPATRTHSAIINAKVLRFGPIEGFAPPPGVAPLGQVTLLRQVVRLIQAPGNVDPGTLGNLGLTPHTKKRSIAPTNIPGPELRIIESPPHSLRVRYNQEGKREESKAKPLGCKGIDIRWVGGNGQSGSQTFTKSPALLTLPEAMSGQRIALQAVWVFGNNKQSPVGNVVTGGVP